MYSDVMKTWIDVFQAWPTVADLARDLKVPYQTAAAWLRRKSIPSRYWSALIDSAAQRGIAGLSLDVLARLDAQAAA
jgi:hypothetical protein